MKPVEFKEQTIVIAKDQPGYQPIPAHCIGADKEGRVTFCWKLTFKERLHVLLHGVLWHEVFTFRHPLQPQKLGVTKPYMINLLEKPL